MKNLSFGEMINRYAEIAEVASNDPNYQEYILTTSDSEEWDWESHIVSYKNEIGVLKAGDFPDFEGFIAFVHNPEYQEITQPTDFDTAAIMGFVFLFSKDIKSKLYSVKTNSNEKEIGKLIYFPGVKS